MPEAPLHPEQPDAASGATTAPAPVMLEKLGGHRLYADGISQLMIGYPTSRIVMHYAADKAGQQAQEVRTVAFELTMPTAAMVEMAKLLLAAAQENRDVLKGFMTEHAAKMNEMLDALPEIPAHLGTPRTVAS